MVAYNRNKRRKRQYQAVYLCICACIAGGLFTYLFITTQRRNIPVRGSIVLIGNPFAVLSWDYNAKNIVLIRIPQDVYIDLLHGYGAYSLEAAWKLDSIENRHGELFTRSLQDSLGIPISWYFDIGTYSSLFQNDTISDISSYFSFYQWMNILFQQSKRTNMTTIDWFWINKLIHAIRKDTVIHIDFEQTTSLTDVSLPDGTHIRRFDISAFDARFKSVFEDARIRQEAYSLALYNATQTTGMGQRVGRFLTNLGTHVVFIGNTDEQVRTCKIQGSIRVIPSITGRIIQKLLSCDVVVNEGIQRADLIITLGNAFEKQYMPY